MEMITASVLRHWIDSDPKCSKCGKNLKKNVMDYKIIFIPKPVKIYTYRCPWCGYTEYRKENLFD